MKSNGDARPHEAFLLLLLLAAVACSPALAGRPLAVDDANVNEAGRGQLEVWVARGAGSTVFNLAPAYAPVEGLEFGALLARESNTGDKVSALQVKWRITASKETGCNFGAVAGLSHAAERNTGYLNGLLTCNRPELGSVHFNLGATKPGGAARARSWGLAYEREIMGITPHLEWFGVEHAKPTLQAGVRGHVAPDLQLDGSVGRGDGVTLYTLGAKLGF